MKKKLTEIPWLAQLPRERYKILSTDTSRTRPRITLWQKQNNTIRPKAFTSRYLNDGETIFLNEELEILAVVRGLEKFCFSYTVR